MDGEVVVVTGGAGFVGQHIVKQLLEQGEFLVKEVRTFDIKPFTWCPDLEVQKSLSDLHHVRGDIRVLDDVRQAFRDATVVIHTAGFIDTSPIPDAEQLRAINILGSENVLQACIDNNIPCLVFTSTVDVVIGYSSIENGTETTVGIPQHHLFGMYATTKYEAEKIVLKANNLILQNGSRLQTCSLRPTPMYGEGDVNLTDALRRASKSRTMPQMGDESSRYQCTYVGNVAWAHVLAVREMIKPSTSEPMTGQAFFITDDTPIGRVSNFIHPFVTGVGAKMSNFALPFWLMYTMALFVEFFAWLLQPFYRVRTFFTTSTMTFVWGVYYFSSEEARNCLGYEPLYNYDESVERSIPYYRRECGLS